MTAGDTKEALIALARNDILGDLSKSLTTGAKVRATLAEHHAGDRRATPWARFAGAMIDLKVVLEISTSIDPIDAGAIAADAFCEHLLDAGQKRPCLFFG